uniref:Leukocyte cell derived chemotaxin 2 n=1 Tax=Strix occidentalis caurina TaxID=311401 RepID=A0A8D0FPG7_STROC
MVPAELFPQANKPSTRCFLLDQPPTAAQWAKICSSQPANKIRGCDSQGCGGYNDPRGGRKHRGVDVVCEDGAVVYAPFTGMINKQARPYGNGNAIDNGVQLSGSGTRAERHAASKNHEPTQTALRLHIQVKTAPLKSRFC